jgi:thiol-disulfide isomerase/thioredoxin
MSAGVDAESLFATGVLRARGEDVTTTECFETAVEEYAAEVVALPPDELAALVGDRLEREAVVEPFAELGVEDPRYVAELFALRDHLEPSPDEDWLALLPVLWLFRSTGTPTDGVPDPFVPVPATHLPHLTRIYSPAIVYVWLDDCPPCETVKSDLESIFEEPRELMPFAVYGPDHREFLAETYGVTAGPALLFMLGGRVDSRLYGAQPERTVRSELSTLLEQRPPA